MKSTILPKMALLASIVSWASLCVTQSVPTYAPIPKTGFGPPVSNTTGFRVQSFGKGAYLVTDGLYQAMFLVACDSVLVVDAPPTIGHNILNGIRTITDLPISHVIYSHAHADHIGAAYLLQGPKVNFIAHEQTKSELAQTPDPTRPAPNITFTDSYTLKACNQTLSLSYKGPNHQPGNIFIYAPLQKVLMLVDVVFPGWVPYDALAESQNIPGYIKAHDQILDYDFTHYIGGHLNRAGTREDVQIQKEYMTDLYNNCAEGLLLSAAPPNATNPVSVPTALGPVIAANPGNSWAEFEYYAHNLITEYCNNKTLTKWLNRLAGADVYGPSNAATMVNSLRIDYGVLGPFGVLPK